MLKHFGPWPQKQWAVKKTGWTVEESIAHRGADGGHILSNHRRVIMELRKVIMPAYNAFLNKMDGKIPSGKQVQE